MFYSLRKVTIQKIRFKLNYNLNLIFIYFTIHLIKSKFAGSSNILCFGITLNV